jgi:hypothetical protein
LESEINHWTKKRNSEKKQIKWTFTRQDTDQKLSKLYVA